jgi:hypothetical protein
MRNNTPTLTLLNFISLASEQHRLQFSKVCRSPDPGHRPPAGKWAMIGLTYLALRILFVRLWPYKRTLFTW